MATAVPRRRTGCCPRICINRLSPPVDDQRPAQNVDRRAVVAVRTSQPPPAWRRSESAFLRCVRCQLSAQTSGEAGLIYVPSRNRELWCIVPAAQRSETATSASPASASTSRNSSPGQARSCNRHALPGCSTLLEKAHAFLPKACRNSNRVVAKAACSQRSAATAVKRCKAVQVTDRPGGRDRFTRYQKKREK